jgi:hypothetical protein
VRGFRGVGMASKVGIIIGILGVGGAAAATGVVLPSHANSHATTSTTDVTTGAPTSAPSEAGTPAPQASFGQCVAANAKTASGSGGQGWNPTQGCTRPGSGEENASGNASDNASDGPSTAAAGGDNGAAHANSNGAANAAARGDNASSHP